MITARSSVTKLSPGIYTLATVLKGKIRTGGRNVTPAPPKPRKPKFGLTSRELTIKRRMEDYYLSSLPDDESELWNRVTIVNNNDCEV